MEYVRYASPIGNQKMVELNHQALLDMVINNPKKDHYASLYTYTESQKEEYDKTKSVGKITSNDYTTNTIVFDFDKKDDKELALNDARTLYDKLLSMGFQENDIQKYHSGGKGFHLVLSFNRTFKNDEVKTIVTNLSNGLNLKTLDTQIYDVHRLFRLPFSYHMVSGNYKTPLSNSEFTGFTLNDIEDLTKVQATDERVLIYNSYNFSINHFPLELLEVDSEPDLDGPDVDLNDIFEVTTGEDKPDFSQKTKELTEAKYALQMGFFEDGERNQAFEILAATYKYLGYPKEFAHRMLKATDELYVKRMKSKGINKELKPKKAIWNENINHVYGPLYRGGTYSEKENPLLLKTIQRYNIKPIKSEMEPVNISDLGGDTFKKYAQSFYESRIYTGLPDLDREFPICAGSNIGIVGASGAGKTSITLSILHEMKKTDAPSVFASLDMSRSRLYEKLLFKVTQGKYDRDFIYKEYLNGNGSKYDAMVKAEYPNVFIYSKSAANIKEIGEYIKSVEQQTGKAVRLLMIDYFERLGSDRTDDTAASKEVAMGIQDLLSDFPLLTSITLLQPNKFSLSGGPESPILSYTSIKGSSALYQSYRQILSLWRPFCSPEYREWDEVMEIAILKNDLGDLGMFKYHWEGKTGNVSMLTSEGLNKYNSRMAQKKQMDAEAKGVKSFDGL